MKIIDYHIVILNRFIMYLFSCSNIVLLPTKKLCQARILPTITNISLINQKVRPLFSIFWRDYGTFALLIKVLLY
jgi:hypothetical protein